MDRYLFTYVLGYLIWISFYKSIDTQRNKKTNIKLIQNNQSEKCIKTSYIRIILIGIIYPLFIIELICGLISKYYVKGVCTIFPVRYMKK